MGEGGLPPDARASRSKPALLLAGALLLCAGAFVFEVDRALGGNELSWAYVFEWPALAGFSVYMWLRLVRQGPVPARAQEPLKVAPEHVAMLEAWRAHQRDLATARDRDAAPAPERDKR